MYTVQIVTGSPGQRANIRSEKFETKGKALAFIRATPHSYIGRNGQVYTIYPKNVKK